MSGPADAPTTPPVDPPAPAPAAPAWHEGVDPELKGHVEKHGWDKLDPSAWALAASKSHREAELAFLRANNMPRDEMVRMPKDPSDPAWGEFWKRAGKPDAPDAYSFDGVKFANGEGYEEQSIADLRALYHEAGLTSAQAAVVSKGLAALHDRSEAAAAEAETTSAAERQQAVNARVTALDVKWGANKAANMALAENARLAMELPESFFDPSLDDRYVERMEKWREYGSRLKDPEYLAGGGAGRDPLDSYTPDAAVAHLRELQADNSFARRLRAGDREATTLWDKLNWIRAGRPQR